MFYEILGYVASVVVLISILVSNVKMFRWINLIGAATFSIYGFLIGAVPVGVMNGAIALIDVYYLVKMYGQVDFFDINDELKGHEFFVKRFLDFYGSDIEKFFPNFRFNEISNPKLILVSRNVNPVGLFVYEEDAANKSIVIHLDYACPKYRDMKNFFHILANKGESFRNQGFTKFVSRNRAKEHTGYLKRVGFERRGQEFEMDIQS